MDSFDRTIGLIIAGLLLALGGLIIIGPRSGQLSTISTADPAGVLYLAPADAAIQHLWFVPHTHPANPREVHATEHGILDFEVSPDGSRIAFSAYNPDTTVDIWLIDPDGANLERLTDCSPGLCVSPIWHPAGQIIAYQRHELTLQQGLGPSRVWLFDITTGETAQAFADNQVLGFGPRWSPDGTYLAIFDGSQGYIRILDVNTGESLLLPSNFGEVGVFTPDSTALIFVDISLDEPQYFSHLFRADLETGGISTYLADSQEDQWPAFSPDGVWLAFGRRPLDREDARYGSQFMLYNTQTQEMLAITENPGANHLDFTWDPTGKRVVYTRYDLTGTFPKPELWLYEWDAPEPILLIENAQRGAWLP